MQKFQEAIQYLLCWNGSKDTYIDLNRSLIHSAVKKKLQEEILQSMQLLVEL